MHRFTAVLLVFSLLMLAVFPTAAQDACPLPPRLFHLPLAQVVGGNHALSAATSLSGDVTATVDAPVQVVSGPICAESINWWWVSTGTQTGWMAEGKDGEYWLEALTPVTITPENATQLTMVKATGIGGVRTLAWEGDDLIINATSGYYRLHDGLPLEVPAPPPTLQPIAFESSPDLKRYYTSDGQYVITATGDTIQVSEQATNKEVTSLKLTPDEIYYLGGVQYFPAQNWLTTIIDCFGGDCGLAHPGLTLWDLTGAKEPYQLEPGGYWTLALNADATKLASGGYDGTLRIWNTATWESETVLWSTGYITGIRFADTGLCYTDDVAIYEFQADHLACVGLDWSKAIISPDGKLTVLLSGGGEGETVKVVDSATQAVIAEFPDYEASFAAAFSPDGRYLVIGPVNNGYQSSTATYLTVWNTETRQVEQQVSMEFASSNVTGMAFSPDGKLLVTTNTGGGLIWDTQTWEMLAARGDFDFEDANTAAFSPDGSLLAIGGGSGFESTSSQSIVRIYAIR